MSSFKSKKIKEQGFLRKSHKRTYPLDPGSEIWQQIHPGPRIKGVKKHRIPDPDPQHWIRWSRTAYHTAEAIWTESAAKSTAANWLPILWETQLLAATCQTRLTQQINLIFEAYRYNQNVNQINKRWHKNFLFKNTGTVHNYRQKPFSHPELDIGAIIKWNKMCRIWICIRMYRKIMNCIPINHGARNAFE
jgi:hypothetical protein